MQPSIRCRNCFKTQHRYQDDRPKKTHPYETFDYSYLYKNFKSIIKILEAITRKMKKSFKDFNQNVEAYSLMIMCSSEPLKDIFDNQSANN